MAAVISASLLVIQIKQSPRSIFWIGVETLKIRGKSAQTAAIPAPFVRPTMAPSPAWIQSVATVYGMQVERPQRPVMVPISKAVHPWPRVSVAPMSANWSLQHAATVSFKHLRKNATAKANLFTATPTARLLFAAMEPPMAPPQSNAMTPIPSIMILAPMPAYQPRVVMGSSLMATKIATMAIRTKQIAATHRVVSPAAETVSSKLYSEKSATMVILKVTTTVLPAVNSTYAATGLQTLKAKKNVIREGCRQSVTITVRYPPAAMAKPIL